jgi:hypothetical protein
MEGEMVHFMQVSNTLKKNNKTDNSLLCRVITEEALQEKRIPTHRLKECFMHGSNTTCHHHIWGFYFEEYKSCVEAAKPPLEVHHTVSPQWYLDQFTAKPGGEQMQIKLWPKDEVAVSMREGRLMACAQYIVIENQVS